MATALQNSSTLDSSQQISRMLAVFAAVVFLAGFIVVNRQRTVPAA